MKTIEKILLAILALVVAALVMAAFVPRASAEMVAVSYEGPSGEYIEELVPAAHWRVTADPMAYVESAPAHVRYEPEVVFQMREDMSVIAVDLLAWRRNEHLRQDTHARSGWIAQVEEGAVTGTPANQEPGFIGRQVDRVKTEWRANPWKLVAIGTGVFLALDYAVFDSGELNLWGLLSSDAGGDSTREGNPSGINRTGGSATVINVKGNNNVIRTDDNNSDSTHTPTVVQPQVIIP